MANGNYIVDCLAQLFVANIQEQETLLGNILLSKGSQKPEQRGRVVKLNLDVATNTADTARHNLAL